VSVSALTKEEKMSLFENLKAKQEALGAKGINPPPATPNVAVATPNVAVATPNVAVATPNVAVATPNVAENPAPEKKLPGKLSRIGKKETSQNQTSSEQAAPKTDATYSGPIVCFGCVPVKGLTFTILADVLVPLSEQLAKDVGKMHWLDMEYNEPYAKLSAAFEAWLAEHRPAVLYVDPQALTTKAVRDVLFARASVVIKPTA
jgi:hypothetical protein